MMANVNKLWFELFPINMKSFCEKALSDARTDFIFGIISDIGKRISYQKTQRIFKNFFFM